MNHYIFYTIIFWIRTLFQIVGNLHLSFQFSSHVTNATFKNYRPISINTISKVFKNLLFEILNNHFNQFLINEHGDMKGRSIVNNLVSFKEFMSFTFGRKILAVYLDGVKVFDTVSFSLLLNKLKQYGINGSLVHFQLSI